VVASRSTERGPGAGDAKKALFERLFAAHHGALQAFFSRRLRRQADTTDLAREVYARMLRVKNPEAIRDMNAYLLRSPAISPGSIQRATVAAGLRSILKALRSWTSCLNSPRTTLRSMSRGR
jgi:hypothetical protein